VTMIEKWVKDFRHAARSLVRTPGFTLTVVVTLALAIGANAAIFSVIKPVLLEPLQFPNADSATDPEFTRASCAATPRSTPRRRSRRA
jgi:hypothetical protein